MLGAICTNTKVTTILSGDKKSNGDNIGYELLW
jgi:hypothetical protein